MKRNIFLLLTAFVLLLPAALKAQYTYSVEIGDFEYNSNSTLLPVTTNYNYSLTQQIYTAAEIDMPYGGTITHIHVADIISSSFNMNGVKVYMKNVTKNSFVSNTDIVPVSESDKVWEGTFTQSGTINLTNPFYYDGTSNLLICFYDPTSGYPGSNHKFLTTSTTTSHPGQQLALAYYGNSAVPNLNNLGAYSGTKTLLNYRADIMMLINEDVRDVYVHGFSEPVWNGHPDYTLNAPSNAPYHINTSATYWQDATLNSVLSAQDVFDQEGHDYVLTVHFTCDPGYRFSDDVDVSLVGFNNYMIAEVGVDSIGLYLRTIPFHVNSGNTVNDGIATSNTIPVYGNYVLYYTKAEFVIPDNKLYNLIDNSVITDITFYADSNYEYLTWQGANFKVFMKEVEDATIHDFYGYEDATVVYEGPLSVVNGEMTITFATPYTYHGAHLLIGVYNTTVGERHPCTWKGMTSYGSSVQDFTSNPLDVNMPSQSNFLPKTTFGVAPAPATLVQIGHGASTVSTSVPTNIASNYSLTQQIYTAEEIGRAGNIYSIAFHNNGDTANRNLDIYMVHTNKTTFSNNTDWVSVTAANRVFSGDVNFLSGEWTTIALTAPFAYNGADNLLVVVDDNTGHNFNGNGAFRVFSASGQAHGCYDTNTNFDPANPSSYNGWMGTSKNQILLDFAPILCPKPTDLAISDTGKYSATLSWMETGTASEWQICVNGDEAHPITATTNPYTLTGLTPHTSYTVKVRANCGGSDGVSAWSPKQQFTTKASNSDLIVQIGQGTNGIEELPTQVGYSYSMSQQIYTAAEVGHSGNINSLAFYYTGFVTTRNIDIYMAHTSKTGFSGSADWVTVTASDLVYSGNVEFLSNDWTTIEFSSLFAYNGTDNLLIVVDDHTGHPSSPSRPFLTFPASSQSMDVLGHSASFNPANPGSYSGTVLNEKNQILLGFISIACQAPTALTVSDIDQTSATLSWTDLAGGHNWEYQYSTSISFAENTISDFVTGSAHVQLAGLTPSTTYYARVRSLCETTSPVFWSSVKSFATEAEPLPTLVQIGDGNGTNRFLPTDIWKDYSLTQQIYTATEIGRAGNIYSIAFYNTGDAIDRNIDLYVAHTPNYHFFYDDDWVSVTPADRVFSGSVTFLSNDWSIIEFQMPFDYNGTDNLLVVMDDNTGGHASGRYFRTFYALDRAIAISEIIDYDPFTISAEGQVLTEKNQIRLSFEPMACPTPNGLISSNIGQTSATLSWTETGTATEWQICVNGDETNLITVTTNPYTITDLTPNTTNSVKVRAHCGDGSSFWSAAHTFTTTFDSTALVQIGNGDVVDDMLPTFTNYDYSLTQQIYTPTEIGRSGNIHSIAFYQTGNAVTRSLNIYMTHIPRSTFYNENDWENVTLADRFFSGSVTFQSNSWTTIELSELFAYNGSDNLLIVVDDKTGHPQSNHPFRVTYASNQAILFYNTETTYNPTNLGNHQGMVCNKKNQIQLGFVPLQCLAPNSINVYNVSQTAARLSWNGPADGQKWEYQYSPTPDFSTGVVSGMATGATQVQLTNLASGTTYYARVRTVCDNIGTSDWTATVSFTTVQVCQVPTDITVSNIGQTTVTVGWNGPADGYEWQYYYSTTADFSENNYTGYVAGTTNHQFAGLTPETTYYFRVRTYCGTTGISEWSETISFTTLPTCHAPTAITVSDVSQTTATLSWTGPADGNEWQYEYSTTADFSTNTVTAYATGATTAQLTGLTPWTIYFARVRTLCGTIGDSDWSVVVVFTTLPPCNAPSYVSVNGIGQTSATLAWVGPANGYEWEYECSTSPDFSTILLNDFVTGVANVQLNGLNSGTTYYARVRTICGTTGISDWTAAVSFTTKIDPASLPVVQIGNGTGVTNILPTRTILNHYLSQQIFTAAEIGRSGNIYSVAFYKGTTNAISRNLDIYMVHTNKTTFSSNTDWTAVTAADRVFSGNVEMLTDAWITIELSVPFAYNGTDNLLLVVDDNTGVGGDNCTFRALSALGQSIYVYSLNADISPSNPGGFSNWSMSNTKNQIRLGFVPITCHAPSDVLVSDISQTSATLSWTNTAFGNEWEYEYSTAPDSSTDNVSGLVTGTTYVDLTGLASGTTYYARVRTLCDTMGASDWTETTFTTEAVIPPFFYITGDDSVCPNQTTNLIVHTNLGTNYLWSTGETGETITVPAGDYSVTVTNTNGDVMATDSFIVMEKTTYNITVSDVVCASELPYVWNGDAYNASGSYSKTLTAANGCDSVVTMNLTVNPIYSVSDAQTICASELPYTWNTITFTAAGTQSATLQTVNGCDSVVTMTLTVNPTYSVTDARTVCASELPYTWNTV
ncbi:MAG: fibronectin type III domain-containing protein, partial [Bacteroidales bacterium]|nr:fibronectin type III domain-containing protein [Bacteroidales bacterium]